MSKVKHLDTSPVRSFTVLTVFVSTVAAIVCLPLGSCFFDTRTVLCEIDGVVLRCGPGQHCTRKNAEVVCINSGSCGDGKINSLEVCDDGNLTDDDGCDSNCTPTECGNGIKTTEMLVEACDDGNDVSGDGCDSNCKTTGCGSGIMTHGEECDDGNDDNEDACLNNCVKAKCGDGFVDMVAEECDDKNTDIDSCPYNQTSCVVCGETCGYVPGVTSRCGDGVLQISDEVCDDGNNMDCGTCSKDCKIVGLNVAIGELVVIAANDYQDINDPSDPSSDDRATFTLNDGIAAALTFEISRDNNVKPGHVPVFVQANDLPAKVRARIIEEIEGSELLFQVLTKGPSGIELRHLRPSGLGNKMITHTVDDTDFLVSGMAGGRGADCSAGVGCKVGADCASNVCNGSTPTMSGMCQ